MCSPGSTFVVAVAVAALCYFLATASWLVVLFLLGLGALFLGSYLASGHSLPERAGRGRYRGGRLLRLAEGEHLTDNLKSFSSEPRRCARYKQ